MDLMAEKKVIFKDLNNNFNNYIHYQIPHFLYNSLQETGFASLKANLH